MATRYPFQNTHYFAIHHCEFTTYTTEDGETLGSIVSRWSPTGGYNAQYQSIEDAMNHYLFAPFSNNPRQWVYDITQGLLIAETLSSVSCKSYAKGDFAKSPTKSELKKAEQGRQPLYVVQFSMALQEVDIHDVSEESVKAVGITPLSL